MKVLFINSVCFGSTGQIIDYLIKTEHKNDDCFVAFGRGRGFKDHRCYKIGTSLSFLFHVFLTRLFDLHGFGSYFATKRFVFWINKLNPDKIWLHNLHGYYLNIKVLFNYLKKSNRNIVWTLHDCWSFTGHCAYFSFIGCNKWRDKCEKCPQKNKYPKSLFSRSKCNFILKRELFTGLKNLKIIVPSNWLKNLVLLSFLRCYDIKVVPNKINSDVFKSTDSNIRKLYGLKDKKIILGVANVWDSRKGLDFFIKLRCLLSQNIAIIVIGLNKKQIKTTSKAGIIALPRVELNELVKMYSSADLFFNPSVEETFGMTTVEAISCGAKSLVFKNTACEEIVHKYPKMGFVTDRDIGSILYMIEKILYEEKN